MNFNVAAESYDRFMGAWATLLAPGFADFAGIAAGQRVLDVGCGPGALTGDLVARVGAANVAAVDPSEPFVAAARARHPGVDVRQAAAEQLPYPDDLFDVAVAQLVVHFMTDPVAGLREMARVTRPGGVVAASVWDFGGGRGPHGPYWPTAKALDPDVDDESDRAGVREGHLSELMDTAGLQDVVETALSVSRAFDDFEEWWHLFELGIGPSGAFLVGLPPDRQAEFRERTRTLVPEGPFELTGYAWAARGRA